MPPQPEVDGVTAEILEAYGWISRSRQYVGMGGAPAPVSPAAIAQHLERFPSAICADEFEAGIFAIDDEFRRHWDEQRSKEREEEARKAKAKKR